ncbi:M42 family metallopeptidase [Candidatus Bathyarchaeota archaeon]|nr:M42 family metallopeptidase [Candidatus Bathyarchaeota archaeon]
MPVNMFSVLKHLMGAPGVTGFEEQRRKRVIELLSMYCDSVSVDVIGNVIGTIGSGEKSVMLAGHYDQIGFMVKHIDEKGYLLFDQVGGWDPRVAYGRRVNVWVGDEIGDFVLGTICTKAAHLADPSEREKIPALREMRIDVGVSNPTEASGLGIKVGCPITPDSDIDYLGKKGSDLVIGPAFDDVCAVAAFIETLDRLNKDPPKNLKIHVVATVQEEVGLRGASVSAYNIQPWCAIAVDVTHALYPGVDPGRVSGVVLGKGPVIGIGANFTRALWEMMESQAKESGMSVQREGLPGASGTDAWAIQITRGGTITGLISVPNRYMHSPNEVISLNDLTNTGKLIALTIKALDNSNLVHTTEVFRK